MSCRYIPPVDVPPYATYVGKTFTRPPTTRVQDSMATNPQCPTSLCSCRAGPNCPCIKSANPYRRRYIKYMYNLY